jgi:hypothetical protein
MVVKKYYIGILFVSIMLSVLSVHADQSPSLSASQTEFSGTAPSAFVSKGIFIFDPVVEGAVITHEFIISNKGNAPLSIEKIVTGCGCTTAEYSKLISPGADGKIKINGNTKGYGGKRFSRTILVYTNDPNLPSMELKIEGQVN